MFPTREGGARRNRAHTRARFTTLLLQGFARRESLARGPVPVPVAWPGSERARAWRTHDKAHATSFLTDTLYLSP